MPTYSNEEYIKIMRPIPSVWPLDKEGIPFVKKSNINISNLNNGKWLISISNANSKEQNSNKKIIHCFKYDNELLRYYNKPYCFLEKVCKYYATATLDFSMHKGMKRAQIIDATFKNRWSGVWLQAQGYERVAVTVGWIDKDTFDICFAGIEDGTLLFISTLGVCNRECKDSFLSGYYEMRQRFPNSPIVCVGNKLLEMDNDVCYVPFRNSFGNWDKYHDYWQPCFLNWDMSIVEVL